MYQFTLLNAGIDWLTATATASGNAFALERWSDEVLMLERDAGVPTTPASRFGYHGRSTDHFFAGVNDHGAMVVVSGMACVPLAENCIRVCDNVSRMDVQATLWTSGEEAPLASETYAALKARYEQHHTNRALGLHLNWPNGEMVTLGKRVSDCYGRIYDKASEAKMGPARTIWRYEVELKRKPALSTALAAPFGDGQVAWASNFVHRWFTGRGVDCPWSILEGRQAGDSLFTHVPSDQLAWFRKTVRHSVAKSVRRHGLPLTLEALGLSHLLEGKAHDA